MRAARTIITLACLAAWAALAAAQEPAATEAMPAFAGANACKGCHEAVFNSWSNTKHARTINRLSKSEREGECIRCHVTGSAEQIAKEGATPSHPNVQCEACHGPGSLHVADASVRTGIARKPDARTCEACHNQKSPHYRGFVYAAMVAFSHKP